MSRATRSSCRGAWAAKVEEVSATERLAALKVAKGLVRMQFTTRNTPAAGRRDPHAAGRRARSAAYSAAGISRRGGARVARAVPDGVRIQEPADGGGAQSRVPVGLRHDRAMRSCSAPRARIAEQGCACHGTPQSSPSRSSTRCPTGRSSSPIGCRPPATRRRCAGARGGRCRIFAGWTSPAARVPGIFGRPVAPASAVREPAIARAVPAARGRSKERAGGACSALQRRPEVGSVGPAVLDLGRRGRLLRRRARRLGLSSRATLSPSKYTVTRRESTWRVRPFFR